MDRMNCWEFTGCGLQQGEEKRGSLGACPALTERRLHGIHGGRNAGRACWVVLGTRCGGQVQTDLREKYETCGGCEFYRVVKQQERNKLILTVELMERLGS